MPTYPKREPPQVLPGRSFFSLPRSCPRAVGGGDPCADAKTLFEARVIEAVGGFTSFNCDGAWRDPNTKRPVKDDNQCYLIRYPTEERAATLQEFHREALRAAQEQYGFYEGREVAFLRPVVKMAQRHIAVEEKHAV